MGSLKRYPGADFEERRRDQVTLPSGFSEASRRVCLFPPVEASRERYSGRIESFSYRFYKRIFDLIVLLFLLPFAAVLFSVLILFIVVVSGMPVFYKQQRVGQDGKLFTLYKFRTMRIDGAQHLSEWFARYPDARKEWQAKHKLKHDPRIIRGGKFLRQTSLDELPQLLNVLRGEMTLVGPRPVVKAELARYGSHVDSYLAAKPGLTGLWQVSGRCNLSYDQRVAIDERYVREWTFRQDLKILLRTPFCVLRREGAC